MSNLDVLSEFHRAREEYRLNADKAVQHGEFRKASELIWGALTQQLKALAATTGVTINRHGEFFTFVRELANEIRNPEFYTRFVELNALHRNFYDEIIPPDTFPQFYERALEYIAELETLTKRQLE